MSDLKLNSSMQDIDLSTNQLVLIDGIGYVRQKILIRLRFFLGEWFLDERLGVPYGRVLGSKDVTAVTSMMRQVVQSTPGVIELTSFAANLDTVTRTYSISFKARSADGVIVVRDVPFIVGA